MQFASPADRSPIPQAEAPRDCPLCPRLVRFRAECRAEFPDWWNAPVPAFGDPDAWLGIVGLAPGKHGANRTGRPFTGDFAGDLLYATLLKFGLAEGAYAADPDDGLRLRRRDHPQRGEMPAAGEQAGAGRDRHMPKLFRGGAGGASEGPRAGRARPDRSCRGRAGARASSGGDEIRPWRRGDRTGRPHSAVELSLLALQPEHRPAERARCSRRCSSARFGWSRSSEFAGTVDPLHRRRISGRRSQSEEARA